MQPLAQAALPAWQTYEAMLRTKAAHFSMLEELEEKYRHAGQRTLAEGVRLEQLLQAHDRQVKAFRQALSQLQRCDLAAHQALIEHIRVANADLSGEPSH